MDKNKLVLPISILLGCIVLGRFHYASQVNKQQSIEKQQQIEIEQEEQAKQALNTCLNNAEKESERLHALNADNCKFGEGDEIDCYNGLFDGVQEILKEDEEKCYKRYPI